MAISARQVALRCLADVLRDKRMLSQLPPDGRLTPEDQARSTRLTTTVLRHVAPLDRVIDRFLTRKPPAALRNLLRLAAAEILIAGEDPHGVVHSAVGLAKSDRRMARASGMVNAVLRKIAVEGPALWADHQPQRLPGWIAKPILSRADTTVLRAIEAAHEAGAPIDITPKRPGLKVPGALPLPTGSLRLPGVGRLSNLPGYDSGDWWVQDAAAALPVRLLGRLRGKRVLDLCAAPGGKTMQMVAAGAQVTALDLSDLRLDRLRQNLARTGMSADLVVCDAFDYTAGPFDAVLLDAPCTATGTIRRHPDLPFVKTAADVEPLTRLQMRLIDHALGLLAPGGRLVFCTCSLLPVEGELQVTAALKRHPSLSILPADPVALGGTPGWRSPEGGIRLRPDMWPGIGGIDGFYMAALQLG